MKYFFFIIGMILNVGSLASSHYVSKNWKNEVVLLKDKNNNIYFNSLTKANVVNFKSSKIYNDSRGNIAGRDLICLWCYEFYNKGSINCSGEVHIYAHKFKNIGLIQAPIVYLNANEIDRMRGKIIADKLYINNQESKPDKKYS